MNKDRSSTAILEDYLAGKLNYQDMYQVERHALEDPFVAEALAGLSASPQTSLQSLSLLQKQLQDRVLEQKSHKKQSVITWQRLSIAATAAVLFIAISTIFWMRENAARTQAVQNQQKEASATVTTYVTTAQPVGGYSAYQVYLQDHNRLAEKKINEEVNLSFKVQADGSPIAIEVLKSPGKAYTDEAVRLVKEGPKWELPEQPTSKVSLSIGF